MFTHIQWEAGHSFLFLVTTAWDVIHMILGYVFFQEWLTLGDMLPNDRNATLSLYGLQIL